jgi:hypothetical protein
MKTYQIAECCLYEVDANDAEEAEFIFLNADKINEFFVAVEDRDITEKKDENL